jgi:hypothetical protein
MTPTSKLFRYYLKAGHKNTSKPVITGKEIFYLLDDLGQVRLGWVRLG